MLFSSSRPQRLPQSTTDSQYDTTTGFSSSSYVKWPRPPAKSNFYTARNVGSNMNPSSRQYQSIRRRNNYLNEPFSDILNYPYLQPQQQPIYATASPQRPTINYLLP
jgi:hypothetical protein